MAQFYLLVSKQFHDCVSQFCETQSLPLAKVPDLVEGSSGELQLFSSLSHSHCEVTTEGLMLLHARTSAKWKRKSQTAPNRCIWPTQRTNSAKWKRKFKNSCQQLMCSCSWPIQIYKLTWTEPQLILKPQRSTWDETTAQNTAQSAKWSWCQRKLSYSWCHSWFFHTQFGLFLPFLVEKPSWDDQLCSQKSIAVEFLLTSSEYSRTPI